jgi:hypothetical protein
LSFLAAFVVVHDIVQCHHSTLAALTLIFFFYRNVEIFTQKTLQGKKLVKENKKSSRKFWKILHFDVKSS